MSKKNDASEDETENSKTTSNFRTIFLVVLFIAFCLFLWHIFNKNVEKTLIVKDKTVLEGNTEVLKENNTVKEVLEKVTPITDDEVKQVLANNKDIVDDIRSLLAKFDEIRAHLNLLNEAEDLPAVNKALNKLEVLKSQAADSFNKISSFLDFAENQFLRSNEKIIQFLRFSCNCTNGLEKFRYSNDCKLIKSMETQIETRREKSKAILDEISNYIAKTLIIEELLEK